MDTLLGHNWSRIGQELTKAHQTGAETGSVQDPNNGKSLKVRYLRIRVINPRIFIRPFGKWINVQIGGQRLIGGRSGPVRTLIWGGQKAVSEVDQFWTTS